MDSTPRPEGRYLSFIRNFEWPDSRPIPFDFNNEDQQVAVYGTFRTLSFVDSVGRKTV